MAVMCPDLVEKLVLVDSGGIKPERAEITDIFLHGADGTRELSFYDAAQVRDYELYFKSPKSPEERERHTIDREAVTRYCWKPYAHDPVLPFLLGRLSMPALIVWGREDQSFRSNVRKCSTRPSPTRVWRCWINAAISRSLSSPPNSTARFWIFCCRAEVPRVRHSPPGT